MFAEQTADILFRQECEPVKESLQIGLRYVEEILQEVCTCMFRCVPVRGGAYLFVEVCTCMNRCVPVRGGAYLFVEVCTCMNREVSVIPPDVECMVGEDTLQILHETLYVPFQHFLPQHGTLLLSATRISHLTCGPSYLYYKYGNCQSVERLKANFKLLLTQRMEKDADILGKYRSISNKLKKCEHTLVNVAGEGQALLEAARNFVHAELDNVGLRCPSFHEHLTAAINCYCHAVRVHIENKNSPLAAALCLELGSVLQKVNKPGEAMVHYQRAADLQSQSPLDCLVSLGHVASCKIQSRDYDGALGVFTEMAYLAQESGGSGTTGQPIGAYCDIIVQCEITRVLLLMLLQPSPQRIRPEHAQTLEKYAWETNEENTPNGVSISGHRGSLPAAGRPMATPLGRTE
ncbi:HAP40-like protein [Mya arenaria]|uniref:HAP40-like protein n=1 Tax=Mya arenaria TaxID=6604 RepID=A0ABY7DNC0_MYAAR|nr:HAP40-like protein [Mya arenaria]